MAVKVQIKSNLVSQFIPDLEKRVDRMGLAMATDIHQQATILAPIDKGHLRNSGRIKTTPNGYAVMFGGSEGGFSVPYAKRRHYENRKNPQTLKYLERAGDNVSKQKTKYINTYLKGTGL